VTRGCDGNIAGRSDQPSNKEKSRRKPFCTNGDRKVLVRKKKKEKEWTVAGRGRG